MQIYSGHTDREQEISSLFSATFTASEGPDEGRLIRELATDLMETAPDRDLFVFSSYDDKELVGCIFFSRLTYGSDDRSVFIMSPVAVKTDRQKRGIGQQLITHGLGVLREHEVDIALTYGDPNYYSKVGFRQISEDFAQAPLKLTHPHGWLGQSLTGKEQKPLAGSCRCVDALNKPELW